MKTSLLILALCLLASPAWSQTPAPQGSNSSQPIEITATNTVEWLRDKKQYVARENVVVTQGTMILKADLLTADYREGAQSSMEIWQLTAEGGVTISDANNTAYGEKAVYNVTDGVATLTGGDLKLVSPDQTVTATDRMEYRANERLAKAIGNAKVVRTKDTLTADTITAFFKDESAAGADSAAPKGTNGTAEALGGGNLDRLEADGKVVIKTPSETLRGSKAVYRADTNTAEIVGKVRVERGENVLEGQRAEVNLTTNVSKMFGSEKEGGRVRGIFFPGSGKSPLAQPNNGGQDKQAPVPPAASPVPQAQSPSTPPAGPARVSPRTE